MSKNSNASPTVPTFNSYYIGTGMEFFKTIFTNPVVNAQWIKATKRTGDPALTNLGLLNVWATTTSQLNPNFVYMKGSRFLPRTPTVRDMRYASDDVVKVLVYADSGLTDDAVYI